ncbi:MAG: ABC-type transport system involved in Fe-S cluster assembly, permease component [Thermoproteota archaeon]|nr:ABC-type transport system involved in Fe-S cluster assembly, permease component [Thermoproteota archaeon]
MSEKSELKTIPHKILAEASKAGIDINDPVSGTLLHIDRETIYSKVNEFFNGKIELLDTKVALQKYAWLNDYMWQIIDREKDEFTKKVATDFSGGYFIRILKNAEVTLPLQSCLMITERGLEQKVHNIIIAEEGSKANILSSCVQHSAAGSASHLGISEFYIQKNATLNFTMVHNWTEETKVRPRSTALIDDGGTFISNYICIRPVRDVQMYPVAYCNGEESKVSFNSILYAQKKSSLDVGSKAILNGKNSRAEMITRSVSRENSMTIVRGLIEGNNAQCKGHLECKGLILDDESYIQSIPEMIARKKGVEITHEAAIGKISEKEILYLMSRKLTNDQAVSMIIRGFMDVGIMALSKSLTEEVNNMINLVANAS